MNVLKYVWFGSGAFVNGLSARTSRFVGCWLLAYADYCRWIAQNQCRLRDGATYKEVLLSDKFDEEAVEEYDRFERGIVAAAQELIQGDW